jgi:hypothetical protein
MSTKAAIAQKLKKTFAKREHVPQNQPLMRPKREWATGLLVAGCLFMLSAATSTYTFVKNQTDVAPVSEIEEPVVYRESTVNEVLAEIKKREERFNTLTGEVVETPERTETEEVPVATSTEGILTTEPVATGTLQFE